MNNTILQLYSYSFALVFLALLPGPTLQAKSLEEMPAQKREFIETKRAHQSSAVDAFRKGDHAEGLKLIEKSVSKSDIAPHADLQRARSLTSVARILANERNYHRSREVSLLALEKLGSNSRSAMKARDNIDSLLLKAQIVDGVLGDGAAAIPIYKEILTLDPKKKKVLERLSLLEARFEIMEARARANAAEKDRK